MPSLKGGRAINSLLGDVPEHDLVCCRKCFFNRILLCRRDQRGNTWCSRAACPGLGFPLGEICPGWALLRPFWCRAPSKAPHPPPSSGSCLQPSPVRSAPRPGGLLRQSQLTGDSPVFQPGCLIHPGGGWQEFHCC